MNRRDARTLFLGKTRSVRQEALQLKLSSGDGTHDLVPVTVRQPTYAHQMRILNARAQAGAENPAADGLAMGIEALLTCVYSDDGERVFEDADRKALMESPGTFEMVQQALPVVMRLIKGPEVPGGGDPADAAVGVAEKNS